MKTNNKQIVFSHIEKAIIFFALIFVLLQQSKASDLPKLKSGEYAVFIEDSYKVFTTKKFENLELSQNCFKKNGQPDCLAYRHAQVAIKSVTFPHELMNHFGAAYCAKLQGHNLIVLDQKRNESNFCRFKDGSMVNSWSAVFKHFPLQVSK